MKPVGLTAERAEQWDKAVVRVLEMHPEARPYVELRQQWQKLYLLTLNPRTPDPLVEVKEIEARAKMRMAYLALSLEVQKLLVL